MKRKDLLADRETPSTKQAKRDQKTTAWLKKNDPCFDRKNPTYSLSLDTPKAKSMVDFNGMMVETTQAVHQSSSHGTYRQGQVFDYCGTAGNAMLLPAVEPNQERDLEAAHIRFDKRSLRRAKIKQEAKCNQTLVYRGGKK